MSASTLANQRTVFVPNALLIPGWVKDLSSFRHWMYSDDFPERGLIAYIQGDIWIDFSPEELWTHNQVKGAFIAGIGSALQQTESGSYVPAFMRWTNVEAELSTQADGLFHSWETVKSGRLRFVKGSQGGIVELEGTPDMVLEIVSAASVSKDTVRLREIYWKAGVTEYWLVDARGAALTFEILRHAATEYSAVESHDGWLQSIVFGRAFQLTRKNDPLGNPLFSLESRTIPQ